MAQTNADYVKSRRLLPSVSVVVIVLVAGVLLWDRGRPGLPTQAESAPSREAPPKPIEADLNMPKVAGSEPPPLALPLGATESATEKQAPSAGRVISKSDPKIGHLPRSAAEVALLFWKAPLKVSSERLLASAYLNPTSSELDSKQRAVLDEIIKRYQSEFNAALRKRGLERNEQLLSLHSRHQLVEVTESLFPPDILKSAKERMMDNLKAFAKREGKPVPTPSSPEFLNMWNAELARLAPTVIPGATSVLQRDEKVFVATASQLRSDPLGAQYSLYLRDGLLGEVLMLLGASVSPSDVILDTTTKYYEISARER